MASPPEPASIYDWAVPSNLQIDIHVLDHTLGYYRLYRTLNPEEEVSTVDVPVRIRVDWARLAHLVRG